MKQLVPFQNLGKVVAYYHNMFVCLFVMQCNSTEARVNINFDINTQLLFLAIEFYTC